MDGHPHLSGSAECELDMSDGELQCDNLPRHRSPRLTDREGVFEVTCMTAAHEFTLDDLPDETVETVTRRLFERLNENREEERGIFLEELSSRGMDIPDSPGDVDWFVVEVTEQGIRDLETDGDYPEAAQMSFPKDSSDGDDTGSNMWEQPGPDSVRVMRVSGWALERIPDEVSTQAVPIEQSEYDSDDF